MPHRATALLAGDRPDVVLVDAAYDAGRCRTAIADAGALAVVLNSPSRSQKHPLDKHLYKE